MSPAATALLNQVRSYWWLTPSGSLVPTCAMLAGDT